MYSSSRHSPTIQKEGYLQNYLKRAYVSSQKGILRCLHTLFVSKKGNQIQKILGPPTTMPIRLSFSMFTSKDWQREVVAILHPKLSVALKWHRPHGKQRQSTMTVLLRPQKKRTRKTSDRVDVTWLTRNMAINQMGRNLFFRSKKN